MYIRAQFKYEIKFYTVPQKYTKNPASKIKLYNIEYYCFPKNFK